MTASRERGGRFAAQLRVTLALLIAFLAVLDLVNVVLLARARDAVELSERERAKTRGREAALTLGPDAVAAQPGSVLALKDAGALDRLARRFDLARVAVLTAEGAARLESGAPDDLSPGFASLGAEDRAALAAGRAVASEMAPRGGGESARLGAFVPVLDSAGRLAAIVLVEQHVPELGRVQRAFRVVVGVQAGGMAIIAIVALVFGRWVSRPYRTLARVAGEAGWAAPGGPADPDDLAAAFRAVAQKLREQDAAIEALGLEGGGLGDLVRFAKGAARSMPTGVMVVDRRGRIAAANPIAESLLGLPEPQGKDVALDGARPALAPLRDLVAACLEEGRNVSREVLEVRRERGPAGHLGVTISLVAGARREVAGALVLMTDLTEIRNVQDQVRLKESLAAVGQLSAGIAHEFRNALGTILGYGRMLEKSADPRVHGPAREILKEIDAVRAQIDEFLLYARPPAPQPAPIDLEALVRGCAETAPPGLAVEVAGEFGVTLGDEGLVRRAFGNLLQNAADIGKEAGRTLSVRIVGRPAGRFAQIEVEDDGPGIPADKRGQVFVPFFTTRARGTGLGLALVQRTLVDLGGSVDVGDGPRGGASFRLRFPLMAPGRGVTNRDDRSVPEESPAGGRGRSQT